LTRFHAHAYPFQTLVAAKLRHTPIAPAHHTLTDHAAPSNAGFIVRDATTPEAITPAATQQACMGKQHGKEKAKIRILPVFSKTPQISAETLGLIHTREYIFRVLRAWNTPKAARHRRAQNTSRPSA
jgi:hypothetical protein